MIGKKKQARGGTGLSSPTFWTGLPEARAGAARGRRGVAGLGARPRNQSPPDEDAKERQGDALLGHGGARTEGS